MGSIRTKLLLFDQRFLLQVLRVRAMESCESRLINALLKKKKNSQGPDNPRTEKKKKNSQGPDNPKTEKKKKKHWSLVGFVGKWLTF